MKKLMTKIAVLPILLAVALTGCSLEVPADPTGDVNPSTTADASTQYVAIGNSLSAGFMDSGLMKAGQANSFPMIVATQMGIKDFSQPWIEFPGIGTTNVGPGNISGVLYYNGATVAPVGMTPAADVSSLLLAAAQPTQYHNLGVPGAFSHDLLNTHSASTSYAAKPPFSKPNSYFEFINRSGADTPELNLFANVDVSPPPPLSGFHTGSQYYQAVAQGPAVVSAWIGGNDFLFGATSGDPMGPANALITQPADFATNYGLFMTNLAAGLLQRNGFPANIVTATLPEVENIPFFLDRPSFEAVFGSGYTYTEVDVEYILFTDFLASGLTQDPTGTLPTNLTLSAVEVAYLDNEVIGAYNQTIFDTVNALVQNPALPVVANVVDFNLAAGQLRLDNPNALRHFLFLRITSPGESIAETAARTYFGLDGVHPNNKGYAWVANEFLDMINATMDTAYPTVPVDAFVWDPTYGQPIPSKAAKGGIPQIAPEVAHAMKMSFR